MTINSPGTHVDGDSCLLAAARLGDERAFGQLIEHHRPGLELYCELMLGCPHRAHAAVQEALLRGWRELARADSHAPARIWLYRLATGVCLEGPDRTDEFRSAWPLDYARDHDG